MCLEILCMWEPLFPSFAAISTSGNISESGYQIGLYSGDTFFRVFKDDGDIQYRFLIFRGFFFFAGAVDSTGTKAPI